MATAVYTLQINNDGSQHTGYPNGDKGVALVAPDSLTASNPTQTSLDLNWNYNSSGHTGFEIQQWIQNASTAWTTIATVSADTRFYQAAGLPSGAHVGHRIRASDEI